MLYLKAKHPNYSLLEYVLIIQEVSFILPISFKKTKRWQMCLGEGYSNKTGTLEAFKYFITI